MKKSIILDADALAAAASAVPAINLHVLKEGITAYLSGLREDEPANLLRNGDICMDTRRHIVLLRGERIVLRPKEFLLLQYFLLNQGKLLSREKILKNVWGIGFEYEVQYLRVYVSDLRAKLKDSFPYRYIITEPHIGYRMEIVQPSLEEAA